LESIGTIEASGRFIISRNSFVVNETSIGPRLPRMEMCFTEERKRTRRTDSGISYVSNEDGSDSSILEMSRDTFPWPMRAI
jgi:hypothetical protein